MHPTQGHRGPQRYMIGTEALEGSSETGVWVRDVPTLRPILRSIASNTRLSVPCKL